MLHTAGREGGQITMAHLLFHHKHSYSLPRPAAFLDRSDLWMRGYALSCLPLTDGCPEGSHFCHGCQKALNPKENAG